MLIGDEAVEKLKNSSVLIFGMGGVGGAVCEALARAGVGEFTLVDNDTVAESNLNRQLIATRSSIGMKKTSAARDRILSVNPEAKVTEIDVFADRDNIKQIIDSSDCDAIADAIDSVRSKIEIAKYAKEKGIYLIASMGTGRRLDPSGFRICDISKTSVCPLAKAVRVGLRKEGIEHLDVLFSPDEPLRSENNTPPASVSYVPNIAGFMIGGHIIRKLIGK